MANDKTRQISLSIDLGGVQKVLLSLDSAEYFSRPFELKIDMLSEHGEVDLLPHLGKPAVTTVMEDGKILRYFHGILVDAELIEQNEDQSAIYRLTLRPRAWLHQQGRNFRIFQNEAVKEIVLEVLKGNGIAADPDNLKGGKRQRSYCVQYGESDFAFVSRLLEEEGIYYYYRHDDKDHTLVLCDSPGAHKPGQVKSLAFVPTTGSVLDVDAGDLQGSAGAYVQDWREHVTTGGELIASSSDFDFKKPNRPLRASSTAEGDHPNDAIEVHSFPGRFYDEEEGKALSQTSLSARRANRRTYRGASRNGALVPGAKFSLTEHPNARFNADYLLTGCQHRIISDAFRSNIGGGGGHIVHFEAVPADTQWKAPQTMPRPVVLGPETAIVTGPQEERDEGIYCDEYGRIKVQFHWDREGKNDADSSCWIRVSQFSALGTIALPRVGQEVLVDFINGDPDRPVVVGRLFNEEHKPVYPLPANKTVSGWLTKTYKEKEASGAKKKIDPDDKGINEIRFEDKAGAEELFVYAQRDMNVRVQKDGTHHLGNDHTIDVGNNRKTEIGGNEDVHVAGAMTVKVDGEILVESKQKITLKVGGSTITMIDGEIMAKADKVLNEGNILSQLAGPGGFVMADPSGVTVLGTMVKINSGGAKAVGRSMASMGGAASAAGSAAAGGKGVQARKDNPFTAPAGTGKQTGSSPGSDISQFKWEGKDSGGGQGPAGTKDAGGGQGPAGSKDTWGNKG